MNNKLNSIFYFLTLTLATLSTVLAAGGAPVADYWNLDAAGGRIVHADNCGTQAVVICMQGRKVVMEVHVDQEAGLSGRARFFNVDPDLTKKGRVIADLGPDFNPAVKIDGRPLQYGVPSTVSFDGMLTMAYPSGEGLSVYRTIYPSMRNAAVIDEWRLGNITEKPIKLDVTLPGYEKSVTENTLLSLSSQGPESAVVKPGETILLVSCLQAMAKANAGTNITFNAADERAGRSALSDAAMRGPGRLETPEPMLDMAFALQKLHVLESPIETVKGVITHNGSLTYSPGIWANDPVEYSSPLFPFFGDYVLNQACMNMYRVWLDHCRQNGIVPFPGSFEGPALKLTQRERGDDAMVLYGLSKFLLFQGDRTAAQEMWPLIAFAAESVSNHTTAAGIVASETDEMEDRYPTGKANLSTSALAYGGYRFAARLALDLGRTADARTFEARAESLRKAIDLYFGAQVEGFNTYRYYDTNTTLRGWILLPLAMGITDRQEGTVAALLSDKLWPGRHEGADILAESTRQTEWGRETYYALRTLFKVGRTEEAVDLTRRVVKAQIFGFRGPYPDEDAIDMLCPGSLYPRVFTEGVFGIEPTGLYSFECTPRLPAEWPRMALRDICAFGRKWDLVVERDGKQQKVTVSSGGHVLFAGSGPATKIYKVSFPEVDMRNVEKITK